jgi:hypothetical protein
MSPYQESQAYKYVKMPQTLTEVRREEASLTNTIVQGQLQHMSAK